MSIRIIQKRIIFSIFDRSLFPDIFPQNFLSCIQLLSHGGCKSLPDSVADSRDESRVECKKILLVRVSSSIRSFLFFDLLERESCRFVCSSRNLSLSLSLYSCKSGVDVWPEFISSVRVCRIRQPRFSLEETEGKPGRRGKE